MSSIKSFSIQEWLAGGSKRRILSASIATVVLFALSVAPVLAGGGKPPAPCPGC
jgi:hypothetical protein